MRFKIFPRRVGIGRVEAIQLARTAVRFPDACIGCGAAHPTLRVGLDRRRQPRVTAPWCAACAAAVRGDRVSQLAFFGTALAPAAVASALWTISELPVGMILFCTLLITLAGFMVARKLADPSRAAAALRGVQVRLLEGENVELRFADPQLAAGVAQASGGSPFRGGPAPLSPREPQRQLVGRRDPE